MSESDEKTLLVTMIGIKDKNNKLVNYLELVEDITSFASFYNEIEKEKDKLNTILEVIPEGVLLFDKNAELVEINPKINELYFIIYRKEVNFHLIRNSLVQNIELNLFLKSIKNLLSSQENSITIEPKSGFYLKLVKINITSGSVIIIYDISNDKSLSEFRERLISTVSHELRNPISAITQSIDNYIRFEESLNNSQKSRLLSIIQENASFLRDIVEDLLLLSRIDNLKLDLAIQECDIYSVINEVIKSFNLKLEMKNISLEFNSGEKKVISIDKQRISQVLRILVDNSLKYSSPNSKISIELDTKYSQRFGNSDKLGILIKISDQGIGIPEADIPHLFSRFYRASNVSTIKGTGLGLSIAKELINMHNGNITLESKVNNGTSFHIFLPISQA